jgi:hypothetical protein
VDYRGLAEKVIKTLEDWSVDTPDMFLDYSGEVNISGGKIESAIEHVLIEEEYNLETLDYGIYDEILKCVDVRSIQNLEEDITEQFRDAEEFGRNPLAYYGMSQKDFL